MDRAIEGFVKSDQTRMKRMRNIKSGRRSVGRRKQNWMRNEEKKSVSTRCDFFKCWHRWQSSTPTLHSSITLTTNTNYLYTHTYVHTCIEISEANIDTLSS